MKYYAVHDTHYTADEPTDKSTVIWRYTNFTKFLSLIDRKALYFPSLTTLKQIDPFEGVWSVGAWKPMFAVAENKEAIRDFKKRMDEAAMESSLDTFVNCWHMSSYESQAMWKLYGNEIALKSTVERLSCCFVQRSKLSNPVYIGKVKYIQYDEDPMSDDDHINMFHIAFRKNKSYEHERELRAVIAFPRETKVLRQITATMLAKKPRNREIKVPPPPAKGIEVAIRPELLIEAIYLSPQTEEWYKELVTSIVRKLHMPIPILRSQVNVVPDL